MRTKSKLLPILLSLVLAVSMCPAPAFADSHLVAQGNLTVQATAHTQDEAVAWARGMAEAHTYCGECVVLIQKYYEYLGVSMPNPYGNANTYANADHIPSGWTVDNTPSLGAVYVEANYSPGHVSIVVGIDSAGTLTTVDSNVEGSSYGQYNAQYFPWSYLRARSTYAGVSGKYFVHPQWSNDNPVGSLDIVEGRSGAVFVRGWAFDPNDKSRSLDIHVYVGAESSAAGGEGHPIKADLERADVNSVYACGNNHGFSTEIDTGKTGRQTVYVFAINVGAGGNVMLGSATVNIGDPSPVGSLDEVKGKPGAVFVGGWAFDPDDTSKQLAIHVYIGNPASGNAELHQVIANLERPDVDKVYSCGKNHGYSATIDVEKTGQQEIHVYAINVGRGGNMFLGSGTVNIAQKPHVHDLAHIPAKAPTVTAEGNSEYWECSSCGKAFSDSSAGTEISKSETVVPKLIDVAGASVSILGSCVYNGSAQSPKPSSITVKLGDTTLEAETDYTATCTNNVNAGTATMTVEGKGRYGGTKLASYTISPAPLSSALVSVDDQRYTGEALTPAPIVKVGSTTLKAGADYAVSYKDNTATGTATVTVTGKGNYTGSKSTTFEIVTARQTSIAGATVTGVKSKTYTGKALAQSPTVKVDGKALKAGTDYALTYSNNVKAGTAIMTITGKGSYAGTKQVIFAIVKANVKNANAAKVKAQKYRKGKAAKPSPKLTYKGKTLKKGTDYTLAYKNNKKRGTATITVKGEGNFKGTKTMKFKIK